MLLGSIVYDLRDLVERGVFDEAEMDAVIPFHDHTEEFWRHTLETNPPMDPLLMLAGLQRLGEECKGPLVGFHVRLEQAIERAEAFAVARRQS
jgi:hypothetical protein